MLLDILDFPHNSVSKESACNGGGPGSIPGSGWFPEGGNGNPLHYSHLENPMDRGAWQATAHRVAELDTTDSWCGWLLVANKTTTTNTQYNEISLNMNKRGREEIIGTWMVWQREHQDTRNHWKGTRSRVKVQAPVTTRLSPMEIQKACVSNNLTQSNANEKTIVLHACSFWSRNLKYQIWIPQFPRRQGTITWKAQTKDVDYHSFYYFLSKNWSKQQQRLSYKW